MTQDDFAKLSDLLYRRSGMVLPAEKKALARARLRPVALRYGFRDTTSLLAELPYPSEALASAITEAMTINETSFYRDAGAFEFVASSALPQLIRARENTRRLRIWSAAASTGQEPYSIAMMLEEIGIATTGWKIDLIATDLSAAAIARAQDGVYSQFETERGLTRAMCQRFFTREGHNWRVADRLRRMVTFRVFNLLDHFGWLGEIDLVLCRNVLMYFDAANKAAILEKLDGVLASDGYLALGANESMSEDFVSVGEGIYAKPRPRLPQLRAG